jgi:hypothetical protein
LDYKARSAYDPVKDLLPDFTGEKSIELILNDPT